MGSGHAVEAGGDRPGGETLPCASSGDRCHSAHVFITIGAGGIEPPTSSASRKRSPTELRACKIVSSAFLRYPARRGAGLRVGSDLNLDICPHCAAQIDRHLIRSQLLDRLVKENFPAVKTQPFLFEGSLKVNIRDRPKQASFFPGFGWDGETQGRQLFNQRLGLALDSFFFARYQTLVVFKDADIAPICLNRQPPRQQIVPRVAVSDFNNIADLPQIDDLFL